MESVARFQILDKAGCILPSTNPLEKDINPSVFPQTMDKSQGKLGSLVIVRQLV